MTTLMKRLGDRALELVVPHKEAGACIPEAGTSCGCYGVLIGCDSGGCYYQLVNFYLTCTGQCTTNWAHC